MNSMDLAASYFKRERLGGDGGDLINAMCPGNRKGNRNASGCASPSPPADFSSAFSLLSGADSLSIVSAPPSPFCRGGLTHSQLQRRSEQAGRRSAWPGAQRVTSPPGLCPAGEWEGVECYSPQPSVLLLGEGLVPSPTWTRGGSAKVGAQVAWRSVGGSVREKKSEGETSPHLLASLRGIAVSGLHAPVMEPPRSESLRRARPPAQSGAGAAQSRGASRCPRQRDGISLKSSLCLQLPAGPEG
ncbi:uncharacterized protein LOC107315174 [Coturnix japonica]|uniref:uncharacterized protein LOC107315174 n=1 Tax=Coturnix japonica TaxID=93934 RepID=UPI00077764D1|nr:uncharacterized protein LOC107315174 [Coturnix japonica]